MHMHACIYMNVNYSIVSHDGYDIYLSCVDSNTKDSKHKTRLIPKSRNGSSESNVTDSPSRESSDGSKHRRRKSRNSNLGQESPATGSKNRIRRKKKSGSMDDSERSSTKGDSITDIDLGENGHHRRKNSDY